MIFRAAAALAAKRPIRASILELGSELNEEIKNSDVSELESPMVAQRKAVFQPLL